MGLVPVPSISNCPLCYIRSHWCRIVPFFVSFRPKENYGTVEWKLPAKGCCCGEYRESVFCFLRVHPNRVDTGWVWGFILPILVFKSHADCIPQMIEPEEDLLGIVIALSTEIRKEPVTPTGRVDLDGW